MTNLNEGKYWFVLKTIFKRELKVKQLLDKQSIENFIPMSYKIITKNGKKQKILMPTIHDLIFVYAEKKVVENFKKYLHSTYCFDAYFMTKKNGWKKELEIVPEKQMQDFMKVASHLEDDIMFYKPEEIELKKGTKIRVIGGVFDGIEGILMKVKGKRNKRIVLQIPGLAVATSYITPELIEIIKEN